MSRSGPPGASSLIFYVAGKRQNTEVLLYPPASTNLRSPPNSLLKYAQFSTHKISRTSGCPPPKSDSFGREARRREPRTLDKSIPVQEEGRGARLRHAQPRHSWTSAMGHHHLRYVPLNSVMAELAPKRSLRLSCGPCSCRSAPIPYRLAITGRSTIPSPWLSSDCVCLQNFWVGPRS